MTAEATIAAPARGARRVEVPSPARALCTLPRVDYEDAFRVELTATEHRTAEQWARAVLEEAPRGVRGALLTVWFAIGVRLGAPWSNANVLGLEVARSEPDVAVLLARSRIGTRAELVFTRERSALVLATFVHHDNRVARTGWSGVAPLHRYAVPSVLTGAAVRERRRR